MCSEFGNWGLPDPECLKDAWGDEPWWFETGHDWGEGVMYAHGVQNRFADWSLGRVFGDLRGFIEAAQWQQFRALKYEIEPLRRMPPIAGYVITELTDAHWECNGLLDMRRNRRVFHDMFRTINADIAIVPRWTRLSYWAGETASFELFIAHGGGPALHGAHLDVTLGKTCRIELADQATQAVRAVGPIAVPVPHESKGCMRRIEFALKGSDGSVIATNYLDIAVHARDFDSAGIGEIWSPDPDLRVRFEALGYHVATDPEAATLWVTSGLDAKSAAHVRQGGRLLMFPAANSGLALCSRIGKVSRCEDAPAQFGAAIGHQASAGCTGPSRFRACPAGPCWMKPSTACSRNTSYPAVIYSISKPGFMPGWSSAGYTSR
jgi:hypothetical protein